LRKGCLKSLRNKTTHGLFVVAKAGGRVRFSSSGTNAEKDRSCSNWQYTVAAGIENGNPAINAEPALLLFVVATTFKIQGEKEIRFIYESVEKSGCFLAA
jgi:hypothetical protein